MEEGRRGALAQGRGEAAVGHTHPDTRRHNQPEWRQDGGFRSGGSQSCLDHSKRVRAQDSTASGGVSLALLRGKRSSNQDCAHPVLPGRKQEGRGLAGRCLIQALPLRSCVALGKASRRLSLLICKQEENPYQPHASPWDQVRSITLSRRGPGGVSQASFLPQAWHPGEQRGGSRRSEPPHRPALSSQNMFAELKGIKNNLGSTLPFFLPVKPQQFARCS